MSTDLTQASQMWQDAGLVALLFAIDPAGTGVALHAGAGPVREHWLDAVKPLLEGAPWRRLPLHIRDERLLGGLDLPATLQAGRPVAQRGVLAESHGGVLLLAMAERLEPATVARLAATLDSGQVRAERDGVGLRHAARFGVIALDESSGDTTADDEKLAPALADRLAFSLNLHAVSPREALANDWRLESDRADVLQARNLLAQVQLPEPMLVALCDAAAALGVASPRAQLAALRVARAHAAWCERDEVDTEDAAVAVRLVLAHRATHWPAQAEDQAATEPDAADAPPLDERDQTDQSPAPPHPPPPPPPPPPPQDNAQTEPDTSADDEPPPLPAGALQDILLQAVLAALPADLLSRLKAEQSGRDAARAAGKAGALQKTGQRGRPIGARRAAPRAGQRLNVIETLRAAVPWQKLRTGGSSPAPAPAPSTPRRIQVRADDFHITRLRPKRQTTTIFAVDASGSSAMHRLAEAKGAVELLLADCYVRRDQVAVLAFRGRTAEVLLPPTRSLVRAKRALAGLPGGGGTPLAAALQAVGTLADAARRRGETALVVLLTDGRANVALDGTGGRARADADALRAAQQLRAVGAAVLLIDTSPQPQAQAARLAEALNATYLPLPQAGAQALSRAVSGALLGAR